MNFKSRFKPTSRMTTLRKLLIKVVLLSLLGYAATYFKPHNNRPSVGAAQSASTDLTRLPVLENAYKTQQSNFQVKQTGWVIKILGDDNRKPKHQRFVVQLDSGQNLLIAHNIDLAPRIENLKEQEKISFYGEYEWNDKGGAIHWTHHDPNRTHRDGWLIYGGRKYD